MLLKALLNVFKVQDFTYASATFRKGKKINTWANLALQKKYWQNWDNNTKQQYLNLSLQD